MRAQDGRMRYAGSSSWQVRVGSATGLVVGLFVRDAAGLRPRTAFDVPPLEPAVEVRAGLVPLAVPEATAQWARWWQQELTQHEVLGRSFCAPDARFGDGEELDALVRACSADALRWAADQGRKRARSREGDIVREAEA